MPLSHFQQQQHTHTEKKHRTTHTKTNLFVVVSLFRITISL